MIIKKIRIPFFCLFLILTFTLVSNGQRIRSNKKKIINDSIVNYIKYSDKIYGAEPNPTGEPIGGGVGYSKMITKYTYLVKTKDELITAIGKAKSGDIIYISDTSNIDLSENTKIIIPKGVTLASGRGHKGSKGALLYSNKLETFPMIYTGGEKVHMTGLRLYGPDTARRTEQMKKLYNEGGSKGYYSIPNSEAISSSFPYTEIDNCELMGWSHAAILLKSTKDSIFNNNYIHHNYIHHNQRSGLGYGVCLDNAQALIEANIFDWCRHAIAGTGRIQTSYEARYNIVLENFNGHAFDMHGGSDRNDSTDIAGNIIKINHNTFKVIEQPSILIRGIPKTEADIYNNLFYNIDTANTVNQVNAKGNMNVSNNKYGIH